MRILRVLIVISLVAAVAPSAFAICGYCDTSTFRCVYERGLQTSCSIITCNEFTRPECLATSARPILLASEYDVASVVVTSPARRVVTAERAVRTASLQKTRSPRSR